MMKTCIVGASGYTGAELAALLAKHPGFELAALFVSQGSQDAGKLLSDLYGRFTGLLDMPLQPLSQDKLAQLAADYDLIFLATPHEASHEWAATLTSGKAVVMDLSGAFRLKDKDIFARFYGFAHEQPELLQDAVYGLADWHGDKIRQAKLVAVPGCYPTASLTALKPLQVCGLLDEQQWPVINAVSGVSGAGRKAALNTSYCEVSLQAYGVLGHRHQPEISAELGRQVIFTPHLGNFKRGILATVTVKVKADVTASQVSDAYNAAYQGNPMVRIRSSWPKIDEVAGTCYCDLHWKLDETSGHLVVTSAIDNLLKGAAAQALQCANIRFGYAPETGLAEKTV
ncbi:N-acetyl-gamma-glutamyl-phosphate reductase [Bowmanella yangjiangensis]|uniref:N-acetyl-gamma-glutamyl-phosphate reductase n=1 Tax=Bowmanella yangjiangensis TaxID=2811230 RepID=A0ABS3CT57_9ALTE|nr:N-acetyl-gamma-glutamyl-phosphate reductase [Bowmanella yangjiangensis]MBN7819611.1 N-acetyl-gamma-glutamyl-phosphate reductase [Bowmanella yangjiangensis]